MWPKCFHLPLYAVGELGQNWIHLLVENGCILNFVLDMVVNAPKEAIPAFRSASRTGWSA
jgi:hypothetical protein